MLEKMFKLKANNTDVKTEVIGGLTTFMTMAYILAVNPSILSALYGTSCKLSICTCARSWIKCLFCIHSMWNYGIRLENRIDGSICGRYHLYCTFTYKCT